MKIDLKTCHWTELPNGWTHEGSEIISKNLDVIKQRIEDFPSDDLGFGKFIAKFYNKVGEPCQTLVSPLTKFIDLVLFNQTYNL